MSTLAAPEPKVYPAAGIRTASRLNVCHLYPFDFDTPYFESLCTGVAAAGVRLLLVSLAAEKPPPWAEAAGARFVGLGAPRRSRYPRAIRGLARLLEEEEVDVLQTHLFDAGILGLLAARGAPAVRTVVTRHHLDDVSLGGTRLHVALDRWMARTADRVVVSSEAVKRHMTSRERLRPDNIRPIHYGFDFERLRASASDRARVRAEWRVDGKFVVGCVGRFFKNKGHEYLIDAVGRLLPAHPDLRVVLLGSGDAGAIEASVRRHGVESAVLFGGYRRDVAACMKGFDLLVHPSLSESFGQVLVEAMAVGTPVIATSVGGVPEIVEDGRTGLLVPPRDPAAIAAAVERLRTEPSLRLRLAREGELDVRRTFTVERMVARQVACYEEISGFRGSRG
jgi:glycosyltransferase involved in cell wall biosynthesis